VCHRSATRKERRGNPYRADRGPVYGLTGQRGAVQASSGQIGGESVSGSRILESCGRQEIGLRDIERGLIKWGHGQASVRAVVLINSSSIYKGELREIKSQKESAMFGQ